MAVAKSGSIIIVGAGVFGLSTALELKKRGYNDITVLDRFVPPAADGSSVDISRIIRSDYADPIYSKMAREALEGWRTEYQDQYYESGFALLSETPNNAWIEKSKAVIKASGGHIDELADASELRKFYPNVQSNLSGLNGYHNPLGGWADAAGGIQKLASRCSVAGVSFITGPRGTVASLRKQGSRVVGVNLVGGQFLLASQVIVSTGAWTNRLLDIDHAASSSGQPVGFIRLTPEEARSLDSTPVMINMSTGVFCFPPTPGTNILKLARHGYGFANEVMLERDGKPESVSSPKFESSNAESGYLPDDAEESLRQGLRQFFPQFSDRPWINRRLCWYTDTPKGDFIIDYHPTLQGLFVATGGAGHGYKFLPVLGKYIADCFENKAPEELRQKWRLLPQQGPKGKGMAGDGSRAGPPLRKLTPLEQAKL
ncbi:FAD dependent oxidoreductase [Penicillium riverlandense]|uniref:FAD dependent oxidoreductase n=1 Tax=Penicillium riverlandense TaxID=1903569 RepID=UPI00254905E6|nr:FAD dependent oxidoreductase [Penicillium riverlandense]KAJ5825682.1 FAD dependent oxidoreductase [Penicillium riverlandense]